jgi:hypothetical protein
MTRNTPFTLLVVTSLLLWMVSVLAQERQNALEAAEAGPNPFRVDPYLVTLTTGPTGGIEEIDIPNAVVYGLCADGDGCEFRLALPTAANSTLATATGILFVDSPNEGDWRLERFDVEYFESGQSGDFYETLFSVTGSNEDCRVGDDSLSPSRLSDFNLRVENDAEGVCVLRIED